MRAAVSSQQAQPHVRRAGLWFGFLGGGIAWTLHLLSAYAIAEFGCVGGLGERQYGSISLVAWLELIATGLTVCLALAATACAYRCERRLRSQEETAAVGEKTTARAGLFASGSFAFVILFESIPIFFYLRDC